MSESRDTDRFPARDQRPSVSCLIILAMSGSSVLQPEQNVGTRTMDCIAAFPARETYVTCLPLIGWLHGACNVHVWQQRLQLVCDTTT